MATPISGGRLAALLAIAFFTAPALVDAVRAQAPAAPAAADPAVPAPALGGDAMQVLDQGPIHEAFAEPVALDAAPRVVVDRQPPEPINELPPEVRPEGANIQWISGYWMYSDEQQDYIWVSGVWRDVPPGRRWVPGHWTNENGSFQWVSGFWAAEQMQEVQMLPHPPATLEVGPSSPAPAANYFWVPGCWIYGDAGYSWRTGYWYAGQANWLWVPDHYCYTPRGSIFISGYWDYGLPYRGMLFAPVWWSRPVWGSVGWYYRPRSIVNTSIILSALFIHGGHNHYYFGHGHWRNDFIRPWWDHGHRGGHHHRHYDPVFAYHRWHDGKNRGDWADNYKRDFDHRRREFDEHRGPGGRPGAGGASRDQLIARAEDWARERGRSGGLRQVTDAERQATMRQMKTSADLREARIKAERTGGSVAVTGDRATGGRGPNRNAGGQFDGNAAGPGRSGATGQAAVDAARRREGDSGRGRPTGDASGAIARADVGNRGPGSISGEGRSAFKLPPTERTTTRGPGAGVAGQTPQTQGSQRSISRQDWQNRGSGGSISGGEARTTGPDGASAAGSVRREFNPGATTGPGGVQGGSQRAWSGSRSGDGSPSARSIPSGSVPSGSFDRGPAARGGEAPGTRSGATQFQQRSSSGNSSFRGYPSGSGFQSGAPSTRSSGPSPSFRAAPSGGSPSFRSSPSGGSSSFRSSPSGPPSSARSYSGSRGPSSSSFQSRGGGGGGSSSFSRGGGGGGSRSSSMSPGGGGGGRSSGFSGGGGGGGGGGQRGGGRGR